MKKLSRIIGWIWWNFIHHYDWIYDDDAVCYKSFQQYNTEQTLKNLMERKSEYFDDL